VCKRWYQREMVRYLSDHSAFEASHLSWNDVHREAVAFNEKWGFETGDGVVYSYGIWKPLKKRFRYIAGTRSEPASQAQPAPDDSASRKPAGPPRQPWYQAHKMLCRLLQQVEKMLLDVDRERQ